MADEGDIVASSYGSLMLLFILFSSFLGGAEFMPFLKKKRSKVWIITYLDNKYYNKIIVYDRTDRFSI